VSAAAPSNEAKHTNRLAKETSPYLLQHQHNPVDWYPWGAEAIERARREDKPIFLSVGYSTCYWCHVMERQSFENEAVAKEMNDRFINIKVDREERPDVDQLYMTAVQVLTRHGGWPMSVWLMPDLRPFYGGTYFPPQDAHGRPGFVTVLRALEDAYRNRRGDVEQTASQLLSILQQLAQPDPPAANLQINDELIHTLVQRSTSDYEPRYGGFGGAPKFPRQTLLEMLLTYCGSEISESKSQILRQVRHALDSMANGGIRDHLGGGFHRYSTDAQWLVPHFEIMLYDNAMLAWCYVEAHRQTGERRYATIARGIFDFVLREMTSPQGAFYTAFDAEVDAQEGLTYLWTPREVEAVLGRDDAQLFNRVYGLDRGPNFADPHHGTGTPDKNILYLPDGQAMEDDPRIAAMRRKLYDARRQRKQPLLDTKILTSWNALMIRAFAFGGQILHEPRYTQAATAAAEFLLRHHRNRRGMLFRTSRDGGTPKYNGFLDDYAFLVQALLSLHRASGEDRWRDEAKAIATSMNERFGDDGGRGGFFFTDRGATDLIVRQKIVSDSPLPSGNAIAAMVLRDLGDADTARQTIAAFAKQLEFTGESMSSMVQAAMQHIRTHGSFTVKGAPDAPQERPLSPEQIAAGVVAARPVWRSPTELALHVQILDGFHINAHDVTKNLVPTQLLVHRDNAVEVDAIEYPPGEERRFSFAEEPHKVYGGEVILLVRFKQPVAGAAMIRLGLQYQACDDSACLPPVTKAIEVNAASW